MRPLPSARRMAFLRFLCTGFGAGYSPVIPGTAGTLVALPFYFIPGFESLSVMLTAIVVTFALGIYGADLIEREVGHDPSIIVIDEIVGMWISLVLLPKTYLIVVIAFVLFRIADIIKPWPARWCQGKTGGWAIMLDDVFAGIYANLVIQIALFFFR